MAISPWSFFAKALRDTETFKTSCSGWGECTAISKKESRKRSELPPGRYFFQFFPKPHLVVRPNPGLRSLISVDYDEAVRNLPPMEVKRFAGPIHAILGLGILPYYSARKNSLEFLNVPGWFNEYINRLKSRYFASREKNIEPDNVFVKNDAVRIEYGNDDRWFSILFERQKKAYGILRLWENTGNRKFIHLTEEKELDIVYDKCTFPLLVEEDVLCYHDELISQMISEDTTAYAGRK